MDLISDGGEEDGGKKRKHCNISTSSTNSITLGPEASLFKAYNNASTDGKVTLVITKQPEKQHRARYHTEGSRGAVKDRGQNGFPTVQLKGYAITKAAILQVFVGSDTGTPIPHLYYQACKVSGKNSTPCREDKKENTDVILIDMDPDKDREVVCDCVGILKERHSDIEGKVPPTKRVNWKKKTTKCRLVFRTEIENDNGQFETLQVVTDTISCTQLPGTPEVQKMSITTCSIEGGEELWMIGKNFLKDTEVIFKEDNEDSPRPAWCQKIKPLKDFFANNHLVVVVPPFRNIHLTQSVVVNVTVKCGSKISEPRPLTLKPIGHSTIVNGTTNNVANLSNGNNRIMKTCKKEPLYVNSSGRGLGCRPTILEHIEEHTPHVPHVSRINKKRRERKTPFTRTRELPEINLEETMFAIVDTPSSSLERGGTNWFQRNTRQTSADRVAAPTPPSDGLAYRHQLIIPDETTTIMTHPTANMENSRTQTFTEDTSDQLQSMFANEQKTVISPTSHFESLSFQQQPIQQQQLSFAGISKSGFKLLTTVSQSQQSAAMSSTPQQKSLIHSSTNVPEVAPVAIQQEQEQQQSSYLAFTTEVSKDQHQQQAPKQDSICNLGIDNSGTDSATISITLPPSVLQNQKQLSTIVNTISKALNHQQPIENPSKTNAGEQHQGQQQQQQQQRQQQQQQHPVVQALYKRTTDDNLDLKEEVQSPHEQQTYNATTVAEEAWATTEKVVVNNPVTNQEATTLLNKWTETAKLSESPWDSSDRDGFAEKRQCVTDPRPQLDTLTKEAAVGGAKAWNTPSDQSQLATYNEDISVAAGVKVWNSPPETQQLQTQQVAWVTSTTIVEDSNWQTAAEGSGIQTVAQMPGITVTTTPTTTGWSFTTPNDTLKNENTHPGDSSNDSGKFTKWESINAKPLETWNPTPPSNNTFHNMKTGTNNVMNTTDWSNLGSDTMNNWACQTSATDDRSTTGAGNTYTVVPIPSEVTNKTWSVSSSTEPELNSTTKWLEPTPDTQKWIPEDNSSKNSWEKTREVSVLSSADTPASNVSWIESKPWPNASSAAVAAEMMPVNPKEVSPMDIENQCSEI
jgi:hypothetical protein